MTQPLVSAVIAARDAASTVTAAIESILAQDGVELEVLVVDDGSVDGTADMAATVDDPRVRVLRHKNPVGRARARNLAVTIARGDYLAVQDADDVSLPGRLRSTVNIAECDRDLAVVSGQALFEAPLLGRWRLRRYPLTDAAIRTELARGSMSLFHGGSLIRRSCFEAAGGYDERCVRAQDLNLMLKLSALGRFAAVPEDIVRYRHPVILPPSYWWQNRRYTREAVRRAHGGPEMPGPPPAPHWYEALRYPPAMARRLARYAIS